MLNSVDPWGFSMGGSMIDPTPFSKCRFNADQLSYSIIRFIVF